MNTLLTTGLMALLLAACASPPPERGGGDASLDSATTKRRAPAPLLEAPPWESLPPAASQVTGLPLVVSNNPEHVFTRGLLVDTSPELAPARRWPGAPEAGWLDEGGEAARLSTEQGCRPGRLRRFSVYLAHILDRRLPGARRLSVLLEADAPTTVQVRGGVGHTGWSTSAGPATRGTDWLGARLAKAYFFGSAPEQTWRLEAKRPTAVFTETAGANDLVEGRFDVEAGESCVRAQVVVHGDEAPGSASAFWAEGDVKWPGWADGVGFGRAAGLFAGDVIEGQEEILLPSAGQVAGRALLRPEQAVPAVGRLTDSARLLFGNYGVAHTHRFRLRNPGDRCLAVDVALASYADRGAGRTAAGSPVPRGPTYTYLVATAAAYRPTMVWNGPLAVAFDGGPRVIHHAVLFPEATARDRAHPKAVMEHLQVPLGTLRLEAGGQSDVDLELPVPGYVLAPMAVLFAARDCEG